MNETRTGTVVRNLDDAKISVVTPAYNEAAVLNELHDRISSVLESCGCAYEILFVNDGSRDSTPQVLDTIAAHDPNVRVLHLSRNFGHQAAVQAGVMHAQGDAVIVMDSDLQDDPAAIREFLDLWTLGIDVVYAIRHGRKENVVKRFLFYSFYRVLNAISSVPIPMDAGNFGLMDRAVVNELNRIGDCDRYFPGLRSWVGFRQVGIPVERGRRHDDKPRVSMLGLFRLARTAIFSFSSAPLSVFSLIAILSLITCLGTTGFALYHKLFTDLAVPGWASTMMIASFFGALNALGISILGEYAIRIYDQVRMRPQYIVGRKVNFDVRSTPSAEDELLDWLADNWKLSQEVRQRTSRREMTMAATGEEVQEAR